MHLSWRLACAGARLAVPLRFIVLVMSIAGCSADDDGSNVAHETPNPPPSERCRSNPDCLVGTTCQVAAALDQPDTRLQVAALPACPNACFEPSQCATGMTCGTVAIGPGTCQQCIAGCKHQDCAAGNVCEANACQPVTPCTAADFAGCPQYWTCDPEGATQPPSAGVPDYDAQWRAHAAGCRPLLCSEPDSQPCPQYTRCDDTVDSCVAMSCTELGICPNSGMVCRAPRTDESSDVFGCVPANCEEGFMCQPTEVCDVAGTHPSSRGCRAQLCSEGYSCPSNTTCRPGTVGIDLHGCLPPPTVSGTCQTDAQCASPQVCVIGQCRNDFGTCR